MGRGTPAELATSPAHTLTLSGKTRSTAMTHDANVSRPGAEPLSPRRFGGPWGTTGCGCLPGLEGPTRPRTAAPRAAPSVGCSARVAAFPALTRATPGCTSTRGVLGAPGPSGPRRGPPRPALTSEVFFFLPLPQSHLSAVTARRKEK